MSSGSKRHQVRRMMAGLLSLTMVATLVTPASSQVYAAALDDTQAEAPAAEAEVPEAEPAEDAEAPAEEAEAPATEVADETAETVEVSAEEVFKKENLSIDDIKEIQAITDMTIYGQGLVEVDITYKDGVDVSGVTAADYVLQDRGSLTPDFGEIEIASAEVDGQTVTLEIANDTGATEANKLIYNGPNKEGVRQRNAFGIYCTGAWYRGTDGKIYYGKDDNDAYENNTTGMGYQARESLELKLSHAGETATADLANEDGSYKADGLWLPTIDENFGEGGLITFEEAGIKIESTAKDATDGTADQYVRGYIHVPENYDGQKALPLVITISGNGTSFWILSDGTNNFGTNVMYDAATTAWLDKDVIVVGIHDRSTVGKGGENYDYVVDDCNVIKYMLDNYNIDEDNIIIHGNSRSTMASSTIIQALAGQPYSAGQDAPTWGSAPRTHKLDKSVYDFTIGTFLCNNGLLGGQGLWTDADYDAVAKTGLRAWCFDSEQDFNNIDNAAKLEASFKKLGVSDEWIAENLRISCFPSEMFYYWGESDHSVTRMNYWYFGEGQVYYGPDMNIVDGQIVYNTKLNPGDKYEVQCRGVSRDGTKVGHEYTLYGENFMDWAVQGEENPVLQSRVESIDTVTVPNFYGQKVSQVTVTFKEGTDMDAVKAAGVTLYDRGSLDAQFGEVKVSDVKYDGNQVILTIDQGSEKVTDRSRNAFGIYATMSWYIDSEGNIFYGKEDTTDALGMTIHANKTGKGYQARKNLDLILCVGNEDLTMGLAMTDGVGNLLENTVWNPVVNEGYDDIETLMVNVGWKAEGYTMMGENGEVPVNVIWPEGYDANRAEKYPVVFYQCGSGLCYWELTDTSVDGVLAPANNPGCNYAFDNMLTGWAEAYPEAIVLSVDVHNTSEVVAAKEVAGVLDYFIANYNADANRIVGVGNSYGTFVVSDVIRQRPELVAAFVENNGNLGTFANQAEVNGTLENSSLKKWTADELRDMIDNQVAVWFINGETDVAHPAVQQDAYTILKREYKAAGMSDEWINQYLRASGYQSWNFKAWGETDHSCTKITAWYYLQNAYLTPNEDSVALKPGDTYRLAGKENAQYYGADKFDYTVYAESVAEWAKDAANKKAEEHLQDYVTDVQYTIVKNFYGYKVGTVTVTFAEDVDAAALAAADFTLYDRGSANPYFGEVNIADVKVAGNVVTLTIDQGSDKTSDRSRNTFGALTTTSWYMDTEGNIFFGSQDANDELGIAINANLTGKGCFPRKNLDLILNVNTTGAKNGIPSTDGMGNLIEGSVWSDIKDESGLSDIKLEMVNVGWDAEGYTIVNELMGTEGKVPVQVIYPEGYDAKRAEKYPVIFYQCGGGVCYWELTDTTQAGVYAPATNLGDNTVYDVMMTKWHEAFPEAIIMSVNVHSPNITLSATEIASVLDYAIANWNVDKDKIVGVGNSQGTLITSEVIRMRSDLIAGYVECNGNLGANVAASQVDGTLANSSLGKWSEEEISNFVKNNVAVWMFNGETDGNNPAVQQDVAEVVKNLYREAGKSEEWIDSHVRASGLQSWKFKKWGETDHSVTKVVSWFYIDNPYNDVNAGQKALKAGDLYRFTGQESNYANYKYTMNYDYTVYAESVSEWVKNLFAGAYEEPVAPEYTDVEAFVARLYENVLGRTPDEKGLAAWVNQLTSGANGGEEVAKGFIFSDEYIKQNTSNDEFVEMLYNTLMNRKSDAAGKKAWVAQLDSKKATREDIVEGFIHSSEFTGICEKYDIFATAAEAFASRLYTECLGRKYDKAGLKAWAAKLHSHEIGGGEAAKGFFFSNEFQKQNVSDKEFVARCYRTFLNREPDAAGQADWLKVLAGTNRENVVNGFIGSDEYAKLCVSYGIDK